MHAHTRNTGERRVGRLTTKSSGRGGSSRAGLIVGGIFLLCVVLMVLFMVLQVRSCHTIRDLEEENASVQTKLENTESQVKTLESSYIGGVEDPYRAGGYFTTGNEELDEKIKAYCDASVETAGESATYADIAYTVYNRICQSEYVERSNNQDPQGPTWAQEYALQFFDEGESGNCYNFTAMGAYILQYFGYDAYAEPCLIEKQSGSWGDHGLVFVKIDGEDKLCDLAAGSNGWMLDAGVYNYTVDDRGQHPTSSSAEDTTGSSSASTESTTSSETTSASSSTTTSSN